MSELIIRHFNTPIAYADTLEAMQTWVENHEGNQADEVWLLEHLPVYTLGQAGDPKHLLQSTEIPLIHCDRGGQITYHGPGQLIVYCLLNLKKRPYQVHGLVDRLEQSILTHLSSLGHVGEIKQSARGVYLYDQKIASIGLRIKRGLSYHGLAYNIRMDLTPFDAINPCGYENLKMTQLTDYHPALQINTAAQDYCQHLIDTIGPYANILQK